MKRRIFSIIAVASVLLAACQNEPTPSPTPVATPAPTEEPAPTATPIVKGQIFKIYSSLPMSGLYAEQSNSIVNAIHLAIEKQTDGGTLCDGIFKVVYESLDDASAGKGSWDMLSEQANANKANADADAMAYIGPFDSGAARVAMPILNRSSLAMVSPAADYVGLTKPYAPSDPDVYFEMGKRNFMRLVPPIDMQGTVAAKWAGLLGATRVFIVEDGEQYGRGPADTFSSAARKGSLAVVGREMIDAQATNLPYIASKILIQQADLIYYSGNDAQKAGAMLVEMRKEHINARFLGTSTILSKVFVTTAGDVAQGAYATSPGIALDKLPAKGQQFAKDYESRYGSKPDTYAFYGYDAVGVVLNTERTLCQKDRVAVLDAIFNTMDYDGVLGKWSFDDSGDITLAWLQGNMFGKGAWQTTGMLVTP